MYFNLISSSYPDDVGANEGLDARSITTRGNNERWYLGVGVTEAPHLDKDNPSVC